ncbi:MAG: chitobiase/beta-hexosaminidase C-terminal domain-containing protein, partial [Candidatus ainarchaeum sp.]|nr:chitobiase/beta-hexosaminidase C-terminal domain-containing protein [Candidatus ainarchaeum sp.]
KANKIIDVSSDMPESVVDQSMVVSSPVVSPASGNYFSSVGVSMTSETANAMIYYTTDSSVPTEQSNLYTGPFSLTSTTTIKAKAFKSGMTPSSVVTNTYTITSPAVVSSPVVSPASGSYFSSVGVIMTSETANAMIYYTTDSSVPTEQSNLYTGPFSLTSTTTIKAKAFKSGMTPSSVVTRNYSITDSISPPVASPISGVYNNDIKVTLTNENLIGDIYYTIDGNDPKPTQEGTILYESPFTVNKKTLVRSQIFTKDKNSQILQNIYDFEVAKVVANKNSGTYTSKIDVSLSTDTLDATIYYSFDNSSPDKNSTLYTSPINISSSKNLYAVAYKEDYKDSNISIYNYTINLNSSPPGGGGSGGGSGGGGSPPPTYTIATPQASVLSGNYTTPITVTLSCETLGSSVYYTTDGTTPDKNKSLFTTPIFLDKNTNLKIRCYKLSLGYSDVVNYNYTFLLPEIVIPEPITKQTLETTLILIHQDKTTMIYSLQNLNKNTYSSDVLFSLEGVSLSKLNIFANDLLDSNISVSKAEQTDYNLELKYLDKVYSTFVIDLTNKDKINRTELEFSVSRKWLEENNLSPKDIISYYVINDQEMLLRLKHTESTEENRIYSLDITPLSGTIIIGSQTQEYKAMTSKQKILGFILLGVIIINIILIILLILKITKKKKEPKDKKDSQEKYFQEKDLRKQQILDDIKNNNLQEKTNPSKNIKIFNSKDFEKANDSKNDSKKETSDFERYKNEKLY